MLPFAGYAFNKSHTAGYGLVSYWTAYLKANYPAEFMAAQLTSNAGNKDKSAVYLAECRRMGIKVLPPCVNESSLRFGAVGSDIRFGLGAVRNVGENVVDAIVRARREKGKYSSFADFLDKSELVVCNKRVIESLVKGGAFDQLGHTRLSLIQAHEDAIDAVAGLKKQEALGQFDLFGATDDKPVMPESSPLAHLTLTVDEWPRKQLLAYEREMLGLYVSAHPLDGAERILRKHAPKPIATIIDAAPKDGEVVLSGMITTVDRRVDKKGQPWAIVTVEDLDASMEVLFFAKSYSVLHEDLVPDSVVTVKGRVNWREDTMSVFGSGVIPVDISDAEHNPNTAAFILRAKATDLSEENVVELKSALRAHQGTTPVEFVVVSSNFGEKTYALDDYQVDGSSALRGELRGIHGVEVVVA
jgi:DNA polymerase-3 subunit alpha